MAIKFENIASVSGTSTQQGVEGFNANSMLLVSDAAPSSGGGSGYSQYSGSSALERIKNDFGDSSEVYQCAQVIASLENSPLHHGGVIYVTWATTIQAAPAKLIGNTTGIASLSAGTYRAKITQRESTDLAFQSGESAEDRINALNSALNTMMATGFKIRFSVVDGNNVLESVDTGRSQVITIQTPSTGTDLLAALGFSGTARGVSSAVDRTPLDSVKRVYSEQDFIGFAPVAAGLLDKSAAEWAAANDAIFFWPIASISESSITQALASKYLHTNFFYGDSGVVHRQNAGFMGVVHSPNVHQNNAMITPFGKVLGSVGPSEGIDDAVFADLKSKKISCYPQIGKGSNTINRLVVHRLTQWPEIDWFLIWLRNTLQRTVTEAITSQKTLIPMTNAGMSVLDNYVSEVLRKARRFGAIGPGVWASRTTYVGSLEYTRNMIRDAGFAVYISPVSQLSEAERARRKAPPIEIALKSIGAVHNAEIVFTLAF